jgi:transcriptional regulator with XRE-family HTH domain
MTTTTLGFPDAILWLKRANALDNVGVADLFGVTESAVSRWLNGHTMPTKARRRRWERDLLMPDGWLDAPTLPAPLLKLPAPASGDAPGARRVAEPEAPPYGALDADVLARCASLLDALHIAVKGLDARMTAHDGRIAALERPSPGEAGGRASDGRP